MKTNITNIYDSDYTVDDVKKLDIDGMIEMPDVYYVLTKRGLTKSESDPRKFWIIDKKTGKVKGAHYVEWLKVSEDAPKTNPPFNQKLIVG